MKNKVAAGIFGIVLGSFGAHKFYLGQIGVGVLYLLFCWTAIPGIIGIIEGILYLTKSDEEFNDQCTCQIYCNFYSYRGDCCGIIEVHLSAVFR